MGGGAVAAAGRRSRDDGGDARDPAGVWTARDAGSSNGTRVDGARIGGAPVPITPGARIEAGTVRLTFYDGASLFMRLRGTG